MLGGRLLIDPESNLVSESLVVIFGWQQSILNYAQVDCLSVLVLLEVRVKLGLIKGWCPVWSFLVLGAFNLRLHDDLLNAEVKVSILNSVECNIELKL